MHPRYFLGLSLPPNISEQIELMRNTLLSGEEVMQPLVPHITLLHPGVLTSVPPMFILPKAKSISLIHLPLQIKLVKTGLFDKRVFYISVECPELNELQNKLTNALPDHVKSSYEFGKIYTPHVTITQAQPRKQLSDELIDNLNNEFVSFLPLSFTCTEISIYKQIKPRQYKISAI